MVDKDKLKVEPVDALDATESLGFQTFRKGTRKAWTKEEDEALVSIIRRLYPHPINPDDMKWDYISLQIPATDGPNSEIRKPKDCRKRWTNSLDPRLRRGRWTQEEDNSLVNAYDMYGPSWQKVAAKIPGRTDDQCAKRYMEVLDPETKDRLKPWNQEEDLRLIRQIKIHGTKWRTIAFELKGRPSLTCRNRWRKLVTQVVRGNADPVILAEVELVNGVTRGIKTEEAAAVPVRTLARKPPPSAITRPSSSETEWKYTISGDEHHLGLPHQRLFGAENGGVIKNQELVQALISYAKTYNLDITVHQHIHHHYLPQPQASLGFETPPFAAGTIAPSAPETQFPVLASSQGFYGLEPELQLSRYQHFNYLPPLTEVPKLNLSVLPPGSGLSKMGLIQHHHHHHHHHHEESREPKSLDLVKLLNDDFRKKEPSLVLNPLTPLTQAVRIAAAEEELKKRSLSTERPAKKLKSEHSDDEEEGLDFWETMRNLTEHAGNSSTKPISQHHPLHHVASVTPQPQLQPPADDEAEEEALNAYGLFYNVYTREGSVHPEPVAQQASNTYDSLVNSFGALPFNPS